MTADNPTIARSPAVIDRRYSAGQFISVRINELSDFQACSSCLELKRNFDPPKDVALRLCDGLLTQPERNRYRMSE